MHVLVTGDSLPSRARARLGGAMLLDRLGPPGRCSGSCPARFDGEVAGGAVEIFVLVNLVGATMELGRSGRSMMMMTSASASGGDGGVAGSLSEVQRRTGSSTAIAKFCSTDGSPYARARGARRFQRRWSSGGRGERDDDDAAAAPAALDSNQLRGHRQQIGKSAALTVGFLG